MCSHSLSYEFTLAIVKNHRVHPEFAFLSIGGGKSYFMNLVQKSKIIMVLFIKHEVGPDSLNCLMQASVSPNSVSNLGNFTFTKC